MSLPVCLSSHWSTYSLPCVPEKVWQLVKETTEHSVTHEVPADAMSESSSTIRLKLQKLEGPSFGLVIARRSDQPPCLFVASLMKDGEAESSGLIRPGDIILQINSIDVSSMSFDEAQKVWRDAERQESIQLMIRCAFGYTTHLETTFDSTGSPRTYRVTQKQFSLSPDNSSKSSLVPIHLNLDTGAADAATNSKRR